MSIPLEQIGSTIFKRSDGFNVSDYTDDIKSFNILFALDGKRSVQTIAEQDAFDLDDLTNRIKEFYDQGLIEPVMDDSISRGRAKKLLDAIIQNRSRGVAAIAKAIKVKIALKGINPDSLTPETPDDPLLLKKLLNLAQSYGLRVKTKANQSKGKTKLILDSIITQRSGGDPNVAKMIRTKFMLKGINPDAFSLDTPDDPNLVKRLKDLAAKMGVKIPSAKARVGDQIEQML
ncbi:MAG: hypothetical protein PVG41_03275 [Desulfobacteraceae bacterium]|jgi:hypothetical protein